MLKLLHTANWHIGRNFGIFQEEDADRLRRDRVTAVETLFGLAERYAVDAVLCAGDLFDQPSPDDQSWQAIRDILKSAASDSRPIILLPGSHDPLVMDSVYEINHDFRAQLPPSVHIVDEDNFELPLNDGVLYSVPCRAHASDKDLTTSLTGRSDDDSRIRIGMVYGTVTSEEGGHNYPISAQAPVNLGLDYLASGSSNAWQEIANDGAAPIVYPGTPEPTGFGDTDCGFVSLATLRRAGASPRLKQERVSRWTWRDETVTSIDQLVELAREDLKSTVLRINLRMTVGMHEIDSMDRALNALGGTDSINARVGAFLCDRSALRVNVAEWSIENLDLPEAIVATVDRLKLESKDSDQSRAEVAQQALLVLQKLLKEKGVIN